MKSTPRIFLISLIVTLSLAICNCNNDTQGKNPRTNNNDPSRLVVDSKTVSMTVKGLTCQECVKLITRTLLAMDGILSVDASLNEKNNVTVSFDQSVITVEQIKNAIRDTGKEIDDNDNERT